MTALLGLRTRLLLARLAGTVPLGDAETRLPGLLTAGVNLVVLRCAPGDDVESAWRRLNAEIGTQVLLAHDLLGAIGDLVVGSAMGPVERPHRHALVGRRVRDARFLKTDADFLLLGPARAGSKLLTEAVRLGPEAVWFAACGVDDAPALLAAGARRLLLEEPTPEQAAAVAGQVRAAWEADSGELVRRAFS